MVRCAAGEREAGALNHALSRSGRAISPLQSVGGIVQKGRGGGGQPSLAGDLTLAEQGGGLEDRLLGLASDGARLGEQGLGPAWEALAAVGLGGAEQRAHIGYARVHGAERAGG